MQQVPIKIICWAKYPLLMMLLGPGRHLWDQALSLGFLSIFRGMPPTAVVDSVGKLQKNACMEDLSC